MLSQCRLLRPGFPLIFPAVRSLEKPFRLPVLRGVLKRYSLVECITVHGFRATFRASAGECTKARFEVKELRLGHAVRHSDSGPLVTTSNVAPRRLDINVTKQLDARQEHDDIRREAVLVCLASPIHEMEQLAELASSKFVSQD